MSQASALLAHPLGPPAWESVDRPFDLRDLRGTTQRATDTLKQVLLAPSQTFAGLEDEVPLRRAAGFMLLMDTVATVPAVIGQGLGWLWAHGVPQPSWNLLHDAGLAAFELLLAEWVEHFTMSLMAVFAGVVPYLLLRVTKLSSRPFDHTARVMALVSGALILLAGLPGFGHTAWVFAMTLYAFLGLTAAHHIDPRKSAGPALVLLLALYWWFL